MDITLPIIDAIRQHKSVANLLNQHHLQGLFYHQFEGKTEDNQKQYKKQWIHNQVLLEELNNIAQQMLHLEVSGTLLKGAHLLFDLYPDLGSRFLSDVDILIEEKEYKEWEQLLLSAGFHPIEIETFTGNNFKSEWCKLCGHVEINLELHTRLFFHLKKENWSREVLPLSPFQKLSLEDSFIHLCGHLAFQHTFLKLYWLFDIYFYVQKYGKQIDWKKIEIKSKEMHLQKSVVMCLWSLHQYFHLEAAISDAFQLQKSQWWQQYLTIDFLLEPDAKKFHYFLIKHASKDRFKEALLYDLAWFWHYKIQNTLKKI